MKSKNIKSIICCRICGSDSLHLFFNLGNQPLANSLMISDKEKNTEYPLSLLYCLQCSLVQLSHTVDPKILFLEYLWVTGTSKKAKDFSLTFYQKFIKRVKMTKASVWEVASNDGTFLQPFKNHGFSVLGIDPAKNIAQVAAESGIPTEAEFFGKDTASMLIRKYGQPKILFARNVLPHVADPIDFVEGLSIALKDDGILAIEAHYAGIILEQMHYDSIYHEHLSYFTVNTMTRLLATFGLHVFDIEESPISGGSLIYYAAKKKITTSNSVKKYLLLEAEKGVNSLSVWEKFAKRSITHKQKFKLLMKKYSAKNARVAGWGASARSSTLLNFCKIDKKFISLIADKNILKQGKFTAGTKIPIIHPDEVFKIKPDVMVILAWNFQKEILKELKEKYKFKGYCIIPLPEKPKVIKLK